MNFQPQKRVSQARSQFRSLRLVAVVTFTFQFVPQVEAARQPTQYEQYMLELVNLARSNPSAEVSRLSGYTWGPTGSPAPADLNEGLPVGTISSVPKQPLAFNLDSNQAASDYTNTLLSNNAFSHVYGGTTTASRLTAAGYDLSLTPSSVTENIALTLSGSPFSISAARVEDQHRQLFIDGDVNNRGHRRTIMGDNWTTIGIGIDTASGYTLVPSATNAMMAIQDYSYRNENFFVTGVAYNDSNLNNFYTPGTGEALGGFTVEAYFAGTNTVAGSTTTFGSGGYALQLPTGTYDVRIFGPGVDDRVSGLTFNNSENVKMDFIDPIFSPIPEPTGAMLLLISAALLGMQRRR